MGKLKIKAYLQSKSAYAIMSFGKRYEYHMKSANESPNSVAAQLRDFSFW